MYKIEVDMGTRHIPKIREGRISFKIFTSKSTGKRFTGRPRHKWEDYEWKLPTTGREIEHEERY